MLPGRVADETTLHRDEKEDVIVSRHLGRGGITVITSGFDSVAAAMRRVLEAYDAAATPVVLWPREHHSPGEVARSQGERINHPWKIVPYSLIMFQHAPSFCGPSVAGCQRRIAAQPVSMPCTSR